MAHTTEDNELLQDICGLAKDTLQVSIDTVDGMLWSQAVAWGILGIVVITWAVSVVTLLVHTVQWLCQCEAYRKHAFGQKAFKCWAVATFLSGFLLYFVGFYWEGTKTSLLALVFRPILSSLEMFVSHSDLIEVDANCKDNPFYMAAFSLTHFSAVAVSASFAINCFWRRIVFWVRRKWWMLFPSGKTVNVFFGIDDRSLMLAKNLHAKAASVGERMLFIDMPDGDNHSAQRLSFSHIFGLFSYKTEQVRRMAGLHPVLMHSAVLLHKVETRDTGHNMLDVLELQDLRQILKHASQVRLFFLSKSEHDNIKSMLNLLQDKVFNDIFPDAYCRARINTVNEAVHSIRNAEIHLVDDAHLSAEALKMMTGDDGGYRAHPIRYVERDVRQGGVTSVFTSLTLGFGDTGQDVFRFVYEFSAFVGTDGRKMPVRHVVIDHRMDELKANLFRRMPVLRTDNSEVELVRDDVHTQSFWERLAGLVDSLNYVVIALGDDDTDITLAVDIYQYVVRHRKGGLDRFGIFVRSYSAENEMRLKRIAAFCRDTIVVFGTMEDIYSKQMIVDNGLTQLARKFYGNYNRVMGFDGPTWDERREQCRQSTEADILMLRKQSLHRKEFQDMENSLHCYTKRMLMDASYLQEPLPVPEDFTFVSATDVDEADAMRRRCLTNLSIGEHLRWNASHQMLGYMGMTVDEVRVLPPNTSCDEKVKKHKYLVDWNSLPEDTRKLDYAVVYTTFMN